MAGVDDEASEGALAEEATIVLFRNPETTGFGALCQRIAASTTLEVCFSPQRSARAPPPRALRLTRAAPASDRHHTRHPDQHGGPMRPKPGQHVRCRLDAAAHRAGPDSQPDLHPGESRQSPQPSRSAARLVAPPPLTHARGAATSPGDVHQDSGDGLPRAPRLSRCAQSPHCFSLPRLPLTQTRGAAQDAWNKLDFIVVFSSWINIAVELFEFDLGIGASPDPAFPVKVKS